MPRSVWHGAISFGLIYVPVDMYSASKDGALALHLLDSRDFAPVGYHRVNKITGKEVDWQHIVKGYEYEKGQYGVLSEVDRRFTPCCVKHFRRQKRLPSRLSSCAAASIYASSHPTASHSC